VDSSSGPWPTLLVSDCEGHTTGSEADLMGRSISSVGHWKKEGSALMAEVAVEVVLDEQLSTSSALRLQIGGGEISRQEKTTFFTH